MKNKGLFLLYGFLITIIIIIFLFVITINTKRSAQTAQILTPTPITIGSSQQKQVNELQPGKSTMQDVKIIYGNPTKIVGKNGYIENDYPITNTLRTDKIYTKNDIVQYISQEQTVDNALYKDFVTKNNKQFNGTLYSPQGYGTNIQWYVFSQDGIAFFADQKTGYTFQTIKFPPMSYQDFLKNVAPLFSMTQQEPEEVKVDGNNPQNQ